jgi:hypothetical protein
LVATGEILLLIIVVYGVAIPVNIDTQQWRLLAGVACVGKSGWWTGLGNSNLYGNESKQSE